jgi:hypothetical protein
VHAGLLQPLPKEDLAARFDYARSNEQSLAAELEGVNSFV